MKKPFIFVPAILLFAGLLMLTCDFNGDEVIVGDFSLTVTVDKTVVKKGDTIKTTVVFKNLSDRDIEAEIPDWLVVSIRRSKGIECAFRKEDILYSVLLENSEWGV